MKLLSFAFIFFGCFLIHPGIGFIALGLVLALASA